MLNFLGSHFQIFTNTDSWNKQDEPGWQNRSIRILQATAHSTSYTSHETKWNKCSVSSEMSDMQLNLAKNVKYQRIDLYYISTYIIYQDSSDRHLQDLAEKPYKQDTVLSQVELLNISTLPIYVRDMMR